MPLGLLHLALALLALAIGARQLWRPKGTRAHRRWGWLFVGAMLVSNLVVLGIYEDSRGPGIFHVLAVVSLCSVTSGALAPRYLPLGAGRRIAHAQFMLWSFGGLVGAGAGQAATAFGWAPWPFILGALLPFAVASARMGRGTGGRPLGGPARKLRD